MNNIEVQKISNKFTRNILLIQGVVFVLLVGVMFSSTYLLKREIADHVSRTVEGKIKRGDTREVINILSDAKTNDFIAVDLYDENSVLQFTFPTRFRRDVSSPRKLWRWLTHATYKKRYFLI